MENDRPFTTTRGGKVCIIISLHIYGVASAFIEITTYGACVLLRNYFDSRAGERGYAEHDIRIYCETQIEYRRKHVNTMILQRSRFVRAFNKIRDNVTYLRSYLYLLVQVTRIITFICVIIIIYIICTSFRNNILYYFELFVQKVVTHV